MPPASKIQVANDRFSSRRAATGSDHPAFFSSSNLKASLAFPETINLLALEMDQHASPLPVFAATRLVRPAASLLLLAGGALCRILYMDSQPSIRCPGSNHYETQAGLINGITR